MESVVYNQEGKAIDKVNLPTDVFGVAWASDLVKEVTLGMTANMRRGTAHTKGRGDVSGGGKKPWQQKGTGRARHGSTRSPIWVGGGVSHGPRNDKDYSQKINKKKKSKALYSILSRKLKDNEILFVDAINFDKPKTKDAKKVLNNLGKVEGFKGISEKKNNNAIIALSKSNKNAEMSLRNFSNITIEELRNVNPLMLLQYKYLVVVDPKVALKSISDKLPVSESGKNKKTKVNLKS
ncbi:MAG: 50S ribosomal protein L4 [Patescibacteria group bacterium]